MTPHPDDAGLRAVGRVRAVREQDSRIGLQRANEEVADAQAILDALDDGLDVPPPSGTSAAAFAAARLGLTALSGRIGTVREELQARRTVADTALAQWHSDRARARAVELLLEHRAAARRAAAERAEARELDDLAAQRHRIPEPHEDG